MFFFALFSFEASAKSAGDNMELENASNNFAMLFGRDGRSS